MQQECLELPGTRALLSPAALTWKPTFMDFSVTQILLLYLWVAA